MKDYEAIVDQIEHSLGSLRTSRVLDVGTNMRTGGMVESLCARAREVVGINLVGKERSVGANGMLMRQDVRDMSFPSESFDIVVSYAVFEHVADFPKALAEMYRVLRPGGLLYSSFGPIWSCKWGHHLWLQAGEEAITYQNLILPSYCHLHDDPGRVRSEVASVVKENATAERIADYLLHTQDQNRLMFSDYRRAIETSSFEVRRFGGSPNKKLDSLYADPKPSRLRELARRYGKDEDFRASSITVFLAKS